MESICLVLDYTGEIYFVNSTLLFICGEIAPFGYFLVKEKAQLPK
jgi:hypothetical protein